MDDSKIQKHTAACNADLSLSGHCAVLIGVYFHRKNITQTGHFVNRQEKLIYALIAPPQSLTTIPAEFMQTTKYQYITLVSDILQCLPVYVCN